MGGHFQADMRKKKQPMSTVSPTPSLQPEAEDFSLPVEGEPLEAVLGRIRESLTPADQLPSAADMLAKLFPPEGDSAQDLRVQAALELSSVVTEDSPAATVPDTFIAPHESQAGEHFSAVATAAADAALPKGEVRENPVSIPSEAVIPGRSPVAGEAISDASQSAEEHSVSPEPDPSPPIVEQAKIGSRHKTPALSGLAALTRGWLNRMVRSFAGESKAGVSGSEVAATAEAVDARAQAEPLPPEDRSANRAFLIEEQATQAHEPSAFAGYCSQAAISGTGRMEIPPVCSPLSGDGTSSLEPRSEVPVEDHSTSRDSSQTKPVFEDERELVDTSDDDYAIASAIERYANLTDPARAGTVESAPAESVQEPPVEKADLNVILGIPRDAGPDDSVLGYVVPSVDVPGDAESPVPSGAVASAAFVPPQDAPAQDLPVSAAPPAAVASRDWSFEDKLASHHEWIESKGAAGERVDFVAADLEGNDLIGASLRYMDLHDANLRSADLLMADLRDACLVRVNFRDACLVGTNLEAANLEGASLDTSMGLVPHQLAGANLHEAALPSHILQFEALSEFKRASRTVYGYFVAMMSLSVLSWLIVWMTKDFQLIANAAVLPFLHSPAAANALPTVQFYLTAPFALFIVYLVFHFHLQHLWDTVLELPAVFPDGRALGENEPRIVVGLLRAHFRWMNQDPPSTRVIEKALSLLMAYWIVPATLLLYWLRYLTLQEIHGTILQEMVVVGAAGAALYSTTKVGRPAARWILEENIVDRAFGKLGDINPVTTALILLGVLTFVSVGTMAGVPHGKERAPQFSAGSIRRWAPTVLWSLGIDPYADLTEAVISTKPANWNGSDDQVSLVQGARLNDSNFRYAQAYRVFLANAHLLHAKLQGAFLSQADLRGADLGQGDLRYAILDQAQMNHANLDRAILDGANLSRSDLRAANLSYASLAGAALVDARADGATLYGAKLLSATLIRTNFEKADLRESHLDNANLEHVNMQGAYLWSAKLPGAHLNNAQLGTAIFVDADLRGADLRWAQLPGTVLTGADLTGALLDGADFRGAVGFGANQVCSAKSRKGLLLDDAIGSQVTAQCGAANQ
jgi:uncharacterized protein YjbI with pentapeptide repeats